MHIPSTFLIVQRYWRGLNVPSSATNLRPAAWFDTRFHALVICGPFEGMLLRLVTTLATASLQKRHQ